MDSQPSGERIAGMAKFPRKAGRPRRRNYVRQWRKHRGLTLERLAELAEVTPGAINQLENGRVSYTQPMLEALAEALNCQPADLIQRPPSEYDELAAVYNALEASQRPVAIEILKALKPRT